MIKQNDPFLPIFNRVCENKSKRLESKNLKQVITNVRVMQKRGSPAGCSYNPNANIKDLDLALEQSKRRERDFDGFILKEFKKLNFSARTHRGSFKKEPEPLVTGLENNQFLNSIPETHLTEKYPESQSFSHQLKKIPRTRVQTCSPNDTYRKSRITKEFITRLSTPATHYFNLPLVSRVNTAKDSNKMDKLMSDCEELNNDMKKINFLKKIEEDQSCKEKIKLEEFLTGKKKPKKSKEDNKYMEEQVSLDLKMAKNATGRKKIWKFNHISFITTVDRMINSVPIVKK